jgi:AcrR family transcriptional regulator
MKELELNTELKILEAAKHEFLERGFDGARMQKIAERADINKALLHYYFRNKENLFKAVFGNVFGDFFPNIMNTFKSELSFFEKVRLFIDGYVTILNKNPKLPAFILHEIQRRPELLLNSLAEQGINPKVLVNIIDAEIRKGTLRPFPVEHLIINLLAMCIFPMVAAPIMKEVLFEGNETKYEQFLEERKQYIYEFIINTIKK